MPLNITQVLFADSYGNEIDYDDLSDGESQLLQIMALACIFNHDRSIFLFDEPETHLNPSWRTHFHQHLFDAISAPGSNNQSQIFLSTHSPFLVSSLKMEDVFYFERDDSGNISMNFADSQTYGASYEVLTKRYYKLTSLMPQTVIKSIKEHLPTNTNPDKVTAREWIEKNLGESMEKGIYFESVIRIMLFSLNPRTPQCEVFKFLNNQLLEFFNRAVLATNFDSNLFEEIEVSGVVTTNVCWSNKQTREKFESFWFELNKPEVDKLVFYQSARDSQNIKLYFDDDSIHLPQIVPESLFDSLKALTTHLYTRTKDLEGTKAQSNSSIGDHYQQFKIANNNSNLCYLCGTMKISQGRYDLDDDEEQWRSDYDHLLCKDKYPLYSVHPGNFIPTCHICNSKAKRARDLLKDVAGVRRKAFYSLPPSTESCESSAKVSFTLKDINQLKLDNDFIAPINAIEINFDGASPELTNKIAVWEEVYKVSSRVKSEIDSSLIDRISGDLMPRDFTDFRAKLARAAATKPLDIKRTEWRFWWHKLYEFLNSSGDMFLNNLWSLIEYKQISVDLMICKVRSDLIDAL